MVQFYVGLTAFEKSWDSESQLFQTLYGNHCVPKDFKQKMLRSQCLWMSAALFVGVLCTGGCSCNTNRPLNKTKRKTNEPNVAT